MKCGAVKTILLIILCCLFLIGYEFSGLDLKVGTTTQEPPRADAETYKEDSEGYYESLLGQETDAAEEEPPLNINRSLQAFIRQNNKLVLSSESEFEGDVCSDVLDDSYYRELLQSYLNLWHKFVPQQSSMDSSNCWYVENFNTLPAKQIKNPNGFLVIKSTNSKQWRDKILGKMFSNGTEAVFSTEPTKQYLCLPIVYMIGFAKAGSTLLYSYLAASSLLAKPQHKENMFWRSILAMRDEKYRELAAYSYLCNYISEAHQQIQRHPDMFTIDAAINVAHATVKPIKDGGKDACLLPMIISKIMPNLKLLVITRDPVDRLWSDFLYFCTPKVWIQNKATKHLKVTAENAAWLFHNYTLMAVNEFKACIQKGQTQFHCAAAINTYSITQATCTRVRLSVSMYYIHLVKWFQFFPQEQHHVTTMDDLISDPQQTMDGVWEFIGKPPNVKHDYTNKEVNPNPWRSRGPKMLPATRKLLTEFFHPYNVKLSQLLEDERYLWSSKT